MIKQRILITGALGQLGVSLIRVLSKRSDTYILATDINAPKEEIDVDFECVNALDTNRLEELIVQHKIDCIYHLAAILSAKGEKTLFNLGMLMLTLFK